MEKIVWGEAIEVNGKKPEWLGDDQKIVPTMASAVTHGERSAEQHEWGGSVINGPTVSIKLPADHFAYTAIAQGFTPWGGGESAPEDWVSYGEGDWPSNGRETVLYREGTLGHPDPSNPGRWRHGDREAVGSSGWEIIGYRKKSALQYAKTVGPQIERANLDWSKPIEAVHSITGTVVSMTVKGDPENGVYETTETPTSGECNAPTNEFWASDGTDFCLGGKWYIRNRWIDEDDAPKLVGATAERHDATPDQLIADFYQKFGAVADDSPRHIRILDALADIDETTVVVKRMSEVEAQGLAVAYAERYLDDELETSKDMAYAVLKEAGLISTAPPTPIERFAAENPGIVNDENRHWFELALNYDR